MPPASLHLRMSRARLARRIVALTHDGDFVDEQENESRGRDSNRCPIETGEIAGDRQRKRDGSEQRTSDVRSDLCDDKGVPKQISKPEILTKGTNDHEQENANGNLRKPQFRWSGHAAQTSDRRTKTMPSVSQSARRWTPIMCHRRGRRRVIDAPKSPNRQSMQEPRHWTSA